MNANTGRVYWITGLHNSGKTTIGTALYYELRKTHNNLVILDGDIMKQIASGSELASYSQSDRLTRAKRYSAIAKLLADQGLWVIVCAIPLPRIYFIIQKYRIQRHELYLPSMFIRWR